MITEIRPQCPIGTHPVETGRYLIATNEIEKLTYDVTKWIETRCPGAIIYGRPRLGKTRAIKYILQYLPYKFGDSLPVYQICCKQHKTPNESTFYEEILENLNFGYLQGNKANIKRDRLVKFLLEKAEFSGQYRVILFFDDAQCLFEMQYKWLMDIYNELDNYGVSLTILLVGQPELKHQKSAFIQAKKSQIIGRFMVHEYSFTGIKNVEDIRKCLYGYDVLSEYPKESGWSFTKYFFPEVFSEGTRLEDCAEDLYQVFFEARQKAQIYGDVDIPMQYITLAIEYALKNFGANGHNLDWLSRKQWIEAVKYSGYIDAERCT